MTGQDLPPPPPPPRPGASRSAWQPPPPPSSPPPVAPRVQAPYSPRPPAAYQVRPPAPDGVPGGGTTRSGLAIASLILGIGGVAIPVFIFFSPVGAPAAVGDFTFLLGLAASIVGLVLGILAQRQTRSGMSLAGIILSAIGIFGAIVVFIFALLISFR